MQRNIPSIKTLAQVFGDKAPEARRILKMPRAQLEALPAGAARVRECYNPPQTWDVRMHCLAALDVPGLFGLEACGNREGEYMDYLNTGESYAPTLVYWRGRYRVASFGDIVENPRNKF